MSATCSKAGGTILKEYEVGTLGKSVAGALYNSVCCGERRIGKGCGAESVRRDKKYLTAKRCGSAYAELCAESGSLSIRSACVEDRINYC